MVQGGVVSTSDGEGHNNTSIIVDTTFPVSKTTNQQWIHRVSTTTNNSYGGTQSFRRFSPTFGSLVKKLRRRRTPYHTLYHANGIIKDDRDDEFDDDSLFVPNHALRDHFDAVMIRNPARLFETYESYRRSLPVRHSEFTSQQWKLVDFPYFAREEDLRVTTKRLEEAKVVGGARSSTVKYIVSPGCTGKTASICPAFLNSANGRASDDDATKFSHYLYVAFANNGRREFFVTNAQDISRVKDVAEIQGEVFMLGCLRKLFKLEFGPVPIPTAEDLLDQGLDVSGVEEWRELFDSNIGPGRILIHVDEYRNMSENPNFRRGALSAIRNVPADRACLVATYTRVPAEVPPSAESSAATCRRYAVPVPMLAINAALRYAGCPDVPEGLDSSDRRFLATLKFRIAYDLSNKMTKFHAAYTFPEIGAKSSMTNDIQRLVRVYRGCIENAKNSIKVSGPYREFLKLLSDDDNKNGRESFMDLTKLGDIKQEYDDQVITLFLGVSDENFQENKRLRSRLISVSYGDDEAELTLALRDLLGKRPYRSEKGAGVFNAAQKLFRAALRTQNVEDFLSGGPLERAYLWALATKAARTKEIILGSLELPFSCQRVKTGRIFEGDNAFFDGGETLDWSLTDVGSVEPGTIYFAQEREDGEESSAHPMCDIFFVTDNNDLVLLDITGSGGKQRGAETKKKKKKRSKCFIDAWRRDGPAGQGLAVAILCPLGEGVTRAAKHYPELQYIYGTDARKLLCGLLQILAWC